jgi:hypothetical protein
LIVKTEQSVSNIGGEIAELGGMPVEDLGSQLDVMDLGVQANAEAQARVDAGIIAMGRWSVRGRLKDMFRRLRRGVARLRG